ncbi:MAG: mismatch repair protein MutL [Clostridia bacterium]|nr:mismatch repair protein MutL [Clostridia bacterium]MDN5323621.1 mismatch repair protein MutL [Clostridia bacterium]
MGNIKILETYIANKIAAGEIIERPVSVVKELLENSLDAQANFIEIEIKDGGLSLIRVTDNGLGMDSEDAVIAFERHATSKISSLTDLFNISTFGFRGEALPSIAAVSQVLLTTCDGLAQAGTRIKLLGGKIEKKEEIAFSRGTSLEVRNLFFNTPARRKFIKNPSYEGGLITELVTKYSLGHPGIRFKLINNQEIVYDTAGLDTVEARLNNIYGENFTGNFIHFTEKKLKPGVYVEAWLASPKINRNTKNQQTFFINGRLVKSIELNKVLEQAYHTLIPKGRFAVGLISLLIPGTELDVNIHPAKLQVKVNNIDDILTHLVDLFKSRLWNNINKKSKTIFISTPPPTKQNIISYTKHEDNDFFNEAKHTYQQEVLPVVEEKPVLKDENKKDKFIQLKEIDEEKESKTETYFKNNNISFKPIAQLNNSFILAQDRQGLYIIDQHTCHERILYEKFFKEEEKKNIVSENLIIPVTLTLSGQQEGVLLKNILLLNSLGFIIESFGPRTFILRGIPLGLKIDDKEKFFIDLLEELTYNSNLSSAKIKETIITMASCKGAVKANQKLTTEEMDFLIKELDKVDNPQTCPHGRPIIYHISMKELYKIFQRGEYRGE